MDSKSETVPAESGTLLGSFDVTLRVDPGTGTSGVDIRSTSVSDRVGRDLALAVSSLLFIQRQIRSIGDSSRFSAIASLNAACVSARDGHVVKLIPPPSARVAATYRVDLIADGSFHVNVEQKLDGILEDAAGALSAASVALEILTTCAEPHRSFFRQMLEAATSYWRVRRPATNESTWDWAVALRQLDQMSRGLTDPFAPTQMCEACGAVRPIGSSCLRCGAEPPASRPAAPVVPPLATTPPVVVAPITPPAPAPAPEPAVSPPPPVPSTSGGYVPVTAPTPAPRAEVRTEILKATVPVVEGEGEGDLTPRVDSESWPLAGLPRRFAALVLDVASGAILGFIGSFGFLSILVATGGISGVDDPRPLGIIFSLGIFFFYLALGWGKGETLGMLVTRTRLLRPDDRKPAGLSRAFLRAVGAYVTFGLGLIVFLIIFLVNTQLTFIKGLADQAVNYGAIVVGIYVIWLGSGQRIISRDFRQSLADRIGNTIVVVRR